MYIYARPTLVAGGAGVRAVENLCPQLTSKSSETATTKWMEQFDMACEVERNSEGELVS